MFCENLQFYLVSHVSKLKIFGQQQTVQIHQLLWILSWTCIICPFLLFLHPALIHFFLYFPPYVFQLLSFFPSCHFPFFTYSVFTTLVLFLLSSFLLFSSHTLFPSFYPLPVSQTDLISSICTFFFKYLLLFLVVLLCVNWGKLHGII